MGNDQSSSSSPPTKKCSHASLDAYRPAARARSASGTPQLMPTPMIDEHGRLSADCTPRIDRRASVRANCKNSLSADSPGDNTAMGQGASSRRGSRRGSAFGLPQQEGAKTGSLAEAAKLTQYQCSLLVQTWPRIKANNIVFTQAFKMLCFKSQTAREMFQKMSIVDGFKGQSSCDLTAHLRYLTDLFDALFADLYQPAKHAEARCLEIGATHFNMTDKCAGNVWENLGEILAEVITRNDLVRQKREAVKAWISIISYLVDIMKSGYTNEYRRRHGRPSIGHADMALEEGGMMPPQAEIVAEQ